MSYSCDICGRAGLVGYNVSHAHNKTKKRQMPNLRTISLTHSGTSTVKLRVCADDLKELKRRGLLVAWKDRPENKKAEVTEVTVAATIDPTPKKATPKAKKAAKAEKEAKATETSVNEIAVEAEAETEVAEVEVTEEVK